MDNQQDDEGGGFRPNGIHIPCSANTLLILLSFMYRGRVGGWLCGYGMGMIGWGWCGGMGMGMGMGIGMGWCGGMGGMGMG